MRTDDAGQTVFCLIVCMKLLLNGGSFPQLSEFCETFHVLLIIRFSAWLYWITPEAHHKSPDKWCEHNSDKNKVDIILFGKETQLIVPPCSINEPKETFQFQFYIFWIKISNLKWRAHCTMVPFTVSANNSIRWNVPSQHDPHLALIYFTDNKDENIQTKTVDDFTFTT